MLCLLMGPALSGHERPPCLRQPRLVFTGVPRRRPCPSMQVNQDDIDRGEVDCSATITAQSSLAHDVEGSAVTTVVLNHEASINIGGC